MARMEELEDEVMETFQKTIGKSVRERKTPENPNKFLSKHFGDAVRLTHGRKPHVPYDKIGPRPVKSHKRAGIASFLSARRTLEGIGKTGGAYQRKIL